MDKNFVNIDDLVRQRLGGGEEQERSGAWLHMRDLLDKEMPQETRAGFIYWRRMLSAVAVLLLIATISVGGYELSANRNGNNSGNNNAGVTPAIAQSTPIAFGASVTHQETTANQVTSSGIVSNNNAGAKTDKQNRNKIATANNTRFNTPSKNNQNHKHLSTTKKVSDYTTAVNTPASSDKLTVAASNTNTTNNIAVVEKVEANKPVSKDQSGNNDKVKELAAIDKKQSNKNKIKTAALGKVVAMASSANASGSDRKVEETVKTAPSLVKTGADDSKPLAGLTKKASRKAAGNKVKTVTREKMKALALGSHPSSVSDQKATSASKTAAVALVSKTHGSKLSSHSHAIADKKTKGIAAKATKVDPAKIAAVNNDKKVVSSKTRAFASSMTKEQEHMTRLPIIVKPKCGVAANEQKEKRVMQKLVLYEHEQYIKTDPNNGYFNVDTISMKTITEELALAEESSPAAPAEKPSAARKAAPVTTNPPTNNSLASNGNSAGSTSATTDPQILPGASASAKGKPAMGQKENGTTDKSTGSAALQNLESSFNDIKYKVKGVQFAAGLTAGINGTFFGPSSFNGFQFGVTGDFVFSDEWSLGTELKYFQRANNNYSLADNSTTYTQNPNGGYNMQQITNTYSFSTLHSLEMPLIVRYTNGKFNFFVGGNLVYSFSINEGPAQTESNTPVAVQGTNTESKIDPVTDFNSRFGVGCLFGLSYKVTPNVTLDLRNVLTLWDNSSTSGAKYVSDQVYKSPSLQFSLGYRLGGKKHKE